MRLAPSLLRPGLVHLFLARPEALLETAPQHAAWLSGEERTRAQAFRQPGDGARYRATRALVRGVLSGLTGQPAAQLAFVALAHGRPALRPGPEGLDFNASRCPGLLAVVVTSGASCGVDVEDVTRKVDVLGVARAFAPEEREWLSGQSAEEARRNFFVLWTLKEATLKALGAGLTLSLRACSFQLPVGPSPSVRFAPAVKEAPPDWAFRQLAPDRAHLVAVAVRRPQPVDFVVHDEAETCAAVAEAA